MDLKVNQTLYVCGGISSRIKNLIYLCYNLCFILVIETLCQCVGQCVQDCTPWPPLNSTWWGRSSTGKSETLSSQGLLVLTERRSLLSFFWLQLHWCHLSLLANTDNSSVHRSLTARPPSDLRNMVTFSAATRYRTGLYYVGLDVSPNPYTPCAVTQQL